MKEKAFVYRYATAQDFSTRSVAPLLSSVEMTRAETRSTAQKNRAPENRSEARFLGRGAAGATGKAASIARRLPWRLASDERKERKPDAEPPFGRRTSGFLSNHGVPQASARRGTREYKTISARPKAAPFGKRTPFAAYLRLLQER